MTAVQYIFIAVVVVLSSARLTRLVTFDEFPPVRWARHKYEDIFEGSTWQMLAYCPWCASFWVTLAVVLSGYFSDWHTVWWIVNGSLGASYVAAMVMVHDGDDSGDDDNTNAESETV